MSEQKDYRSEIDDWAEMWDEMLDKGVHPEIEKPKASPFAAEIFNDDPQDTYYDYNDSDEMLQETMVQNPIFPDSVGTDQENPKSAWVSEKLLDEISELKDRLFKIENKMARMGQGTKFSEKTVNEDGKKLMGEIDSIRKQIEKVSSQLGIKEEPSPYNVK